jgi:hypothetical protein
MTMKAFETLDGNEAVARVAFQLNEVVALFPITPASPMGEWAAAGVKNLWGTVIRIQRRLSQGQSLLTRTELDIRGGWPVASRTERQMSPIWGDLAPLADHHAEWNVNEGIVATANQHVCLSSHSCVDRALR